MALKELKAIEDRVEGNLHITGDLEQILEHYLEIVDKDGDPVSPEEELRVAGKKQAVQDIIKYLKNVGILDVNKEY